MAFGPPLDPLERTGPPTALHLSHTYVKVVPNDRSVPGGKRRGRDRVDELVPGHYSVEELALIWSVSDDVVRRLFLPEPGVVICFKHRPGKRVYRVLRVPESVARQVHRRLESNHPEILPLGRRERRGIFGNLGVKTRRDPAAPVGREHQLTIHRGFDSLRRGTCLAVTQKSVVVFRATVLSFVLLFAAGPSASVLCKALCEPHAAAANGCHHQDNGTATQVSGNASCQDLALGTTALLKEDVRRGASAEGVGAAVLVASFEFVTTTSSVHPVRGAERGTSDQKRPLSTPLRI